MFDIDLPDPPPAEALAAALVRAAMAIGRLNQALDHHPLQLAFLYRARLDAVRRQAAVDGQLIDPWHLSAVLEGLKLRMENALRIIDRGAIFEAARHALLYYQWLTLPDFDQEGEIREALIVLNRHGADGTALLAAANGIRDWIDQGGQRPPVRSALIRFWMQTGVLNHPIPLTGAAAFRAETSWRKASWVPAFLEALADEAEDWLQLLSTLERAWFAARGRVASRRKHSHAPAAVDVLAATPLISASSLSRALEIAPNNASALLNSLCAEEIAIEVSHRSKRRLFGLVGLEPVRNVARPPGRVTSGRGPGRPPNKLEEEIVPIAAEPPPLPLTVTERWSYDYSDLEHWMANVDQVMRNTKQVLEHLNSKQNR